MQIFKRAACMFFFIGHKTLKVEGTGAVVCKRCGETFWNKARLLKIGKKKSHNKYGKNFFKNNKKGQHAK